AVFDAASTLPGVPSFGGSASDAPEERHAPILAPRFSAARGVAWVRGEGAFGASGTSGSASIDGGATYKGGESEIGAARLAASSAPRLPSFAVNGSAGFTAILPVSVIVSAPLSCLAASAPANRCPCFS